MSLTDTFIRNVKPASSPRKYFDSEGLFLYVPPNGSKLWRMSYRFDGKTKLLSFGKYPTVGLRVSSGQGCPCGRACARP